MELEALLKHKYDPESIPLNLYDCVRACVWYTIYLAAITIPWVALFLLQVSMPKAVCHRAASFKFGVTFLKHKLRHHPVQKNVFLHSY